MDSGVSVKFLMVGETDSMVGYHLMAKGHSIQLGSGGSCEPSPPLPPHLSPAGPEQCPDNSNNVNINNNHSQISASSSL